MMSKKLPTGPNHTEWEDPKAWKLKPKKTLERMCEKCVSCLYCTFIKAYEMTCKI